jgi:hypothetical protein
MVASMSGGYLQKTRKAQLTLMKKKERKKYHDPYVSSVEDWSICNHPWELTWLHQAGSLPSLVMTTCFTSRSFDCSSSSRTLLDAACDGGDGREAVFKCPSTALLSKVFAALVDGNVL